MSDIKRITPSEVVEAYAKTGLGVCRGGYYRNDGACACGLGAYAAAFLGVKPAARYDDGIVSEPMRSAGFLNSYRRGFAAGFDGNIYLPHPSDGDSMPPSRLGYEDGLAAWEAVKEAADDV